MRLHSSSQHQGRCNRACRLLRLLEEHGVYQKGELQPATEIAERSVDELPCCALLAEYLPGPAQCVPGPCLYSARASTAQCGVTLQHSAEGTWPQRHA